MNEWLKKPGNDFGRQFAPPLARHGEPGRSASCRKGEMINHLVFRNRSFFITES
jgi:hypothetical protein